MEGNLVGEDKQQPLGLGRRPSRHPKAVPDPPSRDDFRTALEKGRRAEVMTTAQRLWLLSFRS